MRIVRLRNESNDPVWGVEVEPGEYHAITGDIYGSPQPTDEIITGELMAPVEPTGILCIGLNYQEHIKETGEQPPEHPVLFMKGINSVTAHGQPIELPRRLNSDKVDYEGELAVVIGRDAKNVKRDFALDYVLGYTCSNDVSARDWQKHGGGGQWSRGKTFDTFCPLGPVLVTADEIANPGALELTTTVNGKQLQESNTNNMIFNVAELIEFLSASTTLPAGTVILTGTPPGVGMARDPYVWLKPGDEVTVEIEKIGKLSNTVVEERVID
ncbi:MAG: fumarylacetoacetate hydrolase family protein [Verrucomicrobiota bacterium]